MSLVTDTMRTFPNYLMKDSPYHAKKAKTNEVVFFKPFQREYDTRLAQREQQKRKDDLKSLKEDKRKPFVPTQLPPVLSQKKEKSAGVDYVAILSELKVNKADLVYFETTPVQKQLEKIDVSMGIKIKKGQKRGLNKQLGGIMAQEQYAEPTYFVNQKERL